MGHLWAQPDSSLPGPPGLGQVREGVWTLAHPSICVTAQGEAAPVAQPQTCGHPSHPQGLTVSKMSNQEFTMFLDNVHNQATLASALKNAPRWGLLGAQLVKSEVMFPGSWGMGIELSSESSAALSGGLWLPLPLLAHSLFLDLSLSLAHSLALSRSLSFPLTPSLHQINNSNL